MLVGQYWFICKWLIIGIIISNKNKAIYQLYMVLGQFLACKHGVDSNIPTTIVGG